MWSRMYILSRAACPPNFEKGPGVDKLIAHLRECDSETLIYPFHLTVKSFWLAEAFRNNPAFSLLG
jgi:hypothetical protein